MTIEQTGDRLDQVEHTLSRVVVILEGEPREDLSGRIVGSEGGLVQQGERSAEALNVMSHQLDNILAQLPRRWTVTQRISASMVVVVFLVGMVPVMAWAF